MSTSTTVADLFAVVAYDQDDEFNLVTVNRWEYLTQADAEQLVTVLRKGTNLDLQYDVKPMAAVTRLEIVRELLDVAHRNDSPAWDRMEFYDADRGPALMLTFDSCAKAQAWSEHLGGVAPEPTEIGSRRHVTDYRLSLCGWPVWLQGNEKIEATPEAVAA